MKCGRATSSGCGSACSLQRRNCQRGCSEERNHSAIEVEKTQINSCNSGARVGVSLNFGIDREAVGCEEQWSDMCCLLAETPEQPRICASRPNSAEFASSEVALLKRLP